MTEKVKPKEPRACADCENITKVQIGRVRLYKCLEKDDLIDDGTQANDCPFYKEADE